MPLLCKTVGGDNKPGEAKNKTGERVVRASCLHLRGVTRKIGFNQTWGVTQKPSDFRLCSGSRPPGVAPWWVIFVPTEWGCKNLPARASKSSDQAFWDSFS